MESPDSGQSKKLVIGAIALAVAVAVGGGAFWKIQGDKEMAQKEEAVRVEAQAQAQAAAAAAQRAEAEAKRAAEAQAALDAKQKQVDELAAQLTSAQVPNDLAGQISQAHGNTEQKASEAGAASAPGVPKPYSAIPVAKALPHINAMLKAAYQNNGIAILEAVKAIDDLQKPERGDRKHARALNDEGLRLLKANDFAQAEAAFMRAAEVDPTDREIAGNLGFAYEKMGRLDDACRSQRGCDHPRTQPDGWLGWAGPGAGQARQGKRRDRRLPVGSPLREEPGQDHRVFRQAGRVRFEPESP